MVTSGYVLKIIVKKEYIMRCTYKQGKFTFPPEIKFANDELVIICIEKDDFNIYTNEQFMAATSIIKQAPMVNPVRMQVTNSITSLPDPTAETLTALPKLPTIIRSAAP